MDKGVISMDEYLDNIFFSILEGNRRCAAASKREFHKAKPFYDRLIELAGQDEGEKLWDAAVLVGCSEALPSFREGVRFGLKLLALCLEE